jgi:hypothetical protein
MESLDQRLPHARDGGLLCRNLPDGMMVFYDEERHRAHSLNRAASLVWRHCDGKTSAAEVARLLQEELNLPADEAVVRLALEQLEKAHLLRHRLSPPQEASPISRRSVIRRLGIAGALATLLPMVITTAARPSNSHKSVDKGNNGVGNGLDPQPPGNPPINDGPGTGPGNPGNH